MVNYVCIGKGTTDANGVAHLTHDCQGNELSEVGYRGSGAGDTLIMASLDNPVDVGSIISNVLGISDVDNYLLSLTGDKSIGQTGDHITLSATLTNNGIPVSGKVINFVDPDNSSFSGTYPETTTINQYIGVAWTLSCSYGGYVFVGNNSNFLLISKSVGSVGVYVNGNQSASMTLVNGTVSLNGNVISSGGYSLDCSSYGIDLTNLRSVQVQSGTIEVSVSPIAVASAVTNSSGVAIFDYVCTGSGQKEFGAVYGSLQSETYEVLDCLFLDDCTSDKTSSYSKANCTLALTDGTLVATKSASGDAFVEIEPTGTALNSYLGNTIKMECDIISVPSNVRLQIIQQVSGSWQYAQSDVGTSGNLNVSTLINSSATRLRLRLTLGDLSASDTCTFKDFKVYPI